MISSQLKTLGCRSYSSTTLGSKFKITLKKPMKPSFNNKFTTPKPDLKQTTTKQDDKDDKDIHSNSNNSNNNKPQQQQNFNKNTSTTYSKPFTQTYSSNNINNTVKSHQKSNTFVSSHFKMNEDSILSYLDRKKLIYKILGQEILIKECPFCSDTKGKLDNLWKLYISRETAAYFCHRCGNKGSWIDFKVNLGDLSLDSSIMKSNGTSGDRNTNAMDDLHHDVNPTDLKKMASYAGELDKHPDVIQKLTGRGPGERGLRLETVQHYNVGVTSQSFFFNDEWQEHKCITFPWTSLDKKGNVVTHRCKLRSTKEKSLQRIEPKGGKWGFFGWHTVPADAKEIILTEGEYDAMAVYQETKIPTVSLPNGANSLPVNLLPLLERFEKIYLWMDDDVPGQEGAAKFSEKLGIQRTYIVQTRQNEINGPKDANDALLAGKNLKQILESSTNIPHDQICDFGDVRSIIHSELRDPLSVVGKQSQWFPTFNKTLKGHRKGELTVFSGPTGIGKTSILSQLSLDFATQGVRTLWGSFELKVPRLAKKMLSQYSNKNLEKNVQDYQQIADQFANIPMYFLRFFGSTHIDKVLDAMEYAVYVQDVEHIVLDNLQFMLSGQGKGIEKFDNMDESIEKLRKFATMKNVHITIVIHPRKQEADSTLSINDIFGTAKATQEADNVVIIQNGKNYRYLDIKKNRFSGDVGTIPLKFNSDTNRFSELDPSELQN
ncbi:hypothetical protein CYY_002785 [Polysphondylium violaceum]|uniref:SF4 helicase domain-containing protein n=1 Tax=Polysphondylium violaceum TaxID=133409 RepID=A0A8J4Q132_9MYCE|nr:hypothetical protein CYY_002785 [Polysphondylium violaceum]